MDSVLGSIYKKKYCEGDKTVCARYMVATTIGPEFVNEHLYPNMKDIAEKLIADNTK